MAERLWQNLSTNNSAFMDNSQMLATPTRPPKISLTRKIVFATMSLILFVGVCEFTFKAIGFDFSKLGRDLEATPIFYRIPTEPFGRAHYKRPGGQQWTGRVISAQMQKIGYDGKWLPQEEVITLSYDADGFRNPADLKSWRVVMLGDSFTELGNLSDEELVSTKLGKLLGQTVKNLGVSHTGLVNQTEYLREFGISPETKEVVWVFFEGNDIQDYVMESDRVASIQTGATQHVDLLKTHVPQTSLIEAIQRKLFSKSRLEIYGPAVNATLADGTTQFKIHYAPPRQDDIFPYLLRVESGIVTLAELCKANELQLTCVYMPCKRRAFSGHQYTVADDAPAYLRNKWIPSDLPDWLQTVCRKNGMRFVDVTAALLELNESELLSHNLHFDTHLTAEGATVVSQTIAISLQPPAGSPP